jgi:hypothetical protein
MTSFKLVMNNTYANMPLFEYFNKKSKKRTGINQVLDYFLQQKIPDGKSGIVKKFYLYWRLDRVVGRSLC